MPMSDKEQLQIVKSWFEKYGYYILVLIALVVAFNLGGGYWQKYQSVRLERVSTVYMQMLTALGKQKNNEVNLFGEKLLKNYPKSPYASFAALLLAKNALQSGNLKLACEKLQFAVNHAPDKKIRQLARIRESRVLVAMKNAKEALKLLEIVDDHSYDAALQEVIGDALQGLGKVKEAEQAYQKARQLENDKEPHSPLLKIKLQQF